MKEVMEFDFKKFIQRLKEMNAEHGFKSLPDEPVDKEDVWMIKGYQDCLEDVISIFKECL